MPRRKKDSGLDDLFKFLVAVPWWVGPICAALVYIGGRFLVPVILGDGSTASKEPSAKVMLAPLRMLVIQFAPYAAVLVLFVWAFAELKKFGNRRRLDTQTGLDSIGDLSWQEFEELVAEAYRREGYVVERRGGSGADGGIDVVLRRNGQKTLVQCKHWKTWTVGVGIVRDLRGAMAGEKADYGIVVTYGTFSPEAESFARDNRITLIGGSDLPKMIRSVQRAPRIPTDAPGVTAASTAARSEQLSSPHYEAAPSCPRCGAAMTLRTAKRGVNAGSQFWGCPRYPACQGTRPM